jgi:hypothetical protein
MARMVDTLAAFEVFARKAGLENPMVRESLWEERYEAAHPDVFEAFYATHGSPAGRGALVRELSRVKKRAEEAAPVVRDAIRQVDGALPPLLGVAPEPSPVHVLMVGTFTTNAAVGRLGDDVAVFHCLEWFQSPEGARVLVAHETTHAWHELALGLDPPDDDPAWVAFSEGLAIAASRALVPDRPDIEYFWYGHPEEEWLPWCREHRDRLLEHFRDSLEAGPETTEAYFGGGMIDGHWRVGFFLADDLVARLGRPLPELAAMSVDEGRAAIRDLLGADEPG